jgi:hypothetical protein
MGTPVDPRNEVTVYERGLFANDTGRGLRPAHCYRISRLSENVTILWLEDLTGAKGPAFDIDELAEMAGHLGEWNATTAASPPRIEFPIGGDFQYQSWTSFDFPKRVDVMSELVDDPTMRAMYAGRSLEAARAYIAACAPFADRSLKLPHVLSLADCPVSNFFHLPGETIAIDFAGLGNEPVGADGGRFLGSALTWGRQFAEVLPHERDLFDRYLDGHRAGGSAVERDVLRMGYLSELAFYLGSLVTLPTLFAGPLAKLSVEHVEKRFDMPIEHLGEAAAPIVALLPSYIEEIRTLLA